MLLHCFSVAGWFCTTLPVVASIPQNVIFLNLPFNFSRCLKYSIPTHTCHCFTGEMCILSQLVRGSRVSLRSAGHLNKSYRIRRKMTRKGVTACGERVWMMSKPSRRRTRYTTHLSQAKRPNDCTFCSRFLPTWQRSPGDDVRSLSKHAC